MGINNIGPLLEQGYKSAQDTIIEKAPFFFLVSLSFDKSKRNALYAVFSFCLMLKKELQETKDLKESVNKTLESLEEIYEGEPKAPIAAALHETVRKFDIPPHYFQRYLQAISEDIENKHYRTFEELYDYCYKRFSSLSLIALSILTSPQIALGPHAVDLGIAIGLTLILKNIRKDLKREKLYLAKEELEKFAIGKKDLLNQPSDSRLREFLNFQVSRIMLYYNNSRKGLELLNGQDRLVIEALISLYEKELAQIPESF